MTRRFTSLLALAASAILAGALNSSANAYPDARIEAELRPNFGLLIHPPLHHHHWHGAGWGGGRWVGGRWGGGPCGYGCENGGYASFGPMLRSAVVDCSDEREGALVGRKAEQIEDGGVLILRGGEHCVGPIYVHRHLTIEGEGDGGFNRDAPVQAEGVAPRAGPPVLISTRGEEPCIVVELDHDDDATRPTLVLRDVALTSGPDNRDACLRIEHGQVTLSHSRIDYQGRGAAIYVAHGQLAIGSNRSDFDGDADNVVINAPTAAAGIDVDEGGELLMRGARLVGGRIGVNMRSTRKSNQIIDSVIVLPPSMKSAAGFERGSSGVAAQGDGSTLLVRNTMICGQGVGVYVVGSNTAQLDGDYICQVGDGVRVEGGEFSLKDNRILASNVGVNVGAGRPNSFIAGNQFYGMQYAFFFQPGALPQAISKNLIYTNGPITNWEGAHAAPCAWRFTDDDYFSRYTITEDRERHHRGLFEHEHRRPFWGYDWRSLKYLPSWRNAWSECADPETFPFDSREQDYFGDNWADAYGYSKERWPNGSERVLEPFDGYDWDNSDHYRLDQRHRNEDRSRWREDNGLRR